MTPSEIAALIKDSVKDGIIDEIAGVITFRAEFAKAGVREKWVELAASPPSFIKSVSIIDADSDAVFDEMSFDGISIYRISIIKVEKVDDLRLFMAESLKILKLSAANVSNILIAEMGTKETFTSYLHRFQTWSDSDVIPFASAEPLPDPRLLSKDFSGSNIVPVDIRPWLINSFPSVSGQAFQVWKNIASYFLVSVIADQVSGISDSPTYHFTGPPSCSFKMVSEQTANFFDTLSEGAKWIFTESRDAEVRKLLLSSEWARTFRQGSIGNLGEGALESARSAYNAYVKSGSRDTLKALTDLRKAVVEETQKATQRAQDMAGAIWKDLAVASIPFVFKLFPNPDSGQNSLLSAVVAFAAALFLVYSFFVQVYINYRYFKVQEESGAVWREAVCAVLSPSEVQKISQSPLSGSIADYKRVRLTVGVVYSVLVLSITALGAYEVKISRLLTESSAPEKTRIPAPAQTNPVPKNPVGVTEH